MVTYVAGRVDISQQLGVTSVSAEFLGDVPNLSK